MMNNKDKQRKALLLRMYFSLMGLIRVMGVVMDQVRVILVMNPRTMISLNTVGAAAPVFFKEEDQEGKRGGRGEEEGGLHVQENDKAS